VSAASRAKGVRGEREVALRFEQAGWTVRGLEGQGDQLCVKLAAPSLSDAAHGRDTPAVTLHVECKRQERLRLPEWLEQARAEAPPGVPPVVVSRQSHGQWVAHLPLDDLLRLIG
jgi:hypothetical protein